MDSLDRAPPKTVKIGGRNFPVRTDFRTILKIVRMLEDPDVPEAAKPSLLARWFYADEAPPVGEAVQGFADFVRGDAGEASGESADFSYACDAGVIYASFLSEYGIDLAETPGLHWHRFYALLASLPPESALGRKLRLRSADADGLPEPQRSRVLAAQARAALPVMIDSGPAARAFESVWNHAGD